MAPLCCVSLRFYVVSMDLYLFFAIDGKSTVDHLSLRRCNAIDSEIGFSVAVTKQDGGVAMVVAADCDAVALHKADGPPWLFSQRSRFFVLSHLA